MLGRSMLVGALVLVVLALPAGAGAATRVDADDSPFSGRILLGGTTGPDQMTLSGNGSVYDIRDPGGVYRMFTLDPYLSCPETEDTTYIQCTESAPSRSGQQLEVQPGGGNDQVSLSFPTRNLSGPIEIFDVVVNNTVGSDRIVSTGQSSDHILTKGGSVSAGPGRDRISLAGATAPTSVSAGPGPDIIDSRNNFADDVSCGTEVDSIQKDALDRVNADCDATPAPPVTPVPPPATLAPKARFKGGLRLGTLPKLGRALKRGVVVRVACTKATQARARLTIDRKLAGRVGLQKRRVATGSVACKPAGAKLKLRFSNQARNRLAGRPKLKLALEVTLASGPKAKKIVRLKG